MTIAAVLAIAVGVLMMAQWAITVTRGRVAGPEAGRAGRGNVEMAFHLTAELAAAFLLVIAGTGLLAVGERGIGVFQVANGMLIYTVINSAGYFAQQRKWGMVAMFAVLLVLAVGSIMLAT
jgi:hypothetical protein